MLKSILHRLINIAFPPQMNAALQGVPLEAPETSREPVSEPDLRQALREAQADRGDKSQRVQAEVEGTQRARQLIHDAAEAERAADAAEAAYVASASDWASRGAAGEVVGDENLLKAAEAARAKAFRLRLAAKGAEAAIHQLVWDNKLQRNVSVEMTAAEHTARQALSQAEEVVASAVGSLLRAEIDPVLARALELHAELVDLLPHLHGFHRLLQQNNLGFKVNPTDFADIFRRITTLPKFTSDELLRLTYPWFEFGKRLLNDPEATLSVRSESNRC